MSFSGGVFTRVYSWYQQQVAGYDIDPSKMDTDANDMAVGLSNCLLRDGTGVPTANTPWNNKKITSLAPGAAAGEAVTYDQIAAFTSATVSYQYLDNASFRVNARNKSGTVSLAAGSYGHDRWKAGASGCVYTFAQNGSNVQIQITSGSLLQIVPASEVDAGAYTLSADAATSAQARVYQGSATAYSALPVISGTLAANTNMTVEFGPGVVLKPMLSLGSVARSWAKLSLEAEIARCEFYYEAVDYAVGFGPGPNSPNVGGSAAAVYFRTRKKSTPTCVITQNTITNINVSQQSVDTGGMVLAVFNTTNSSYCKGVGTITASCEP